MTLSPGEKAAAASATILDDLLAGRTERGVTVDSPPGAGKSTLVRAAARRLVESGERVMVIAQTNNQVDDLVAGLAADAPELSIGRLSSGEYCAMPSRLSGLANVTIDQNITDLLGRDVLIGTAAKWSWVKDHRFHTAIVDEAYQMRSDALLLVAGLFERGLFVGDPGQLDPFSIVDTERWTGLTYDPKQNAVDVLLRHNQGTVAEHRLPASWRLTPATTELVSPAFYPYTPFISGVRPGDRRLDFTTQALWSPLDDTLDVAARTGWALHELPSRHAQRTDEQVADAAAAIAARFLARGTIGHCERHPNGRSLTGSDLAIGVVHRDQADQIRQSLTRIAVPGADRIVVDTANRLQGREFEIVIVLHPLSGRRDATAFHLEAGRLCVLTSRHRQACVVVARQGITHLLDAHPATDPVHLNVPVKFPDGWEAHHTLLSYLRPYTISAP